MATVPLVILIGGLAKFLDSSSLPIISITLVTTEILVATALMSAYLARIYKISLGRPIYYVDPYRSFFHDKFETSLNRKTDFHD
jgi:hypothetical protein